MKIQICAFMVCAYSMCVIHQKRIIISYYLEQRSSKSCNGSPVFLIKSPNPYTESMPYIICPPLPFSAHLISHHSPCSLCSSTTGFLAVSVVSFSPLRALVLSCCSPWNALAIYLLISLTSFKSLLKSHPLHKTYPECFDP